MYCKKCYNLIDKNTDVCPKCGNKIKLKKIIKLAVLGLVILGIIITIGIVINNKNQATKKREEFENKPIKIEKLTKENSISFAGYTFVLPNSLQYSNEKNYIYGANNSLTLSFKMNVVLASYDQIKSNYEDLIEAVIKGGTNVISYNVSTYGGREYFLLATVQNNTNYLYAATHLDSSRIVQALIKSSNDDYEQGITYINEIIDSYEKINTDINIEYTASLEDFLITNKNQTNLEDLFKIQNNKEK